MQKLLAAAFALVATLAAQPALAQAEQQSLVAKAEATFLNFERDPDTRWFRENIKKAKAVLVAPEVVKAGFILGGSGGRGVVVARDARGRWLGPAFYTLATVSVGFQAGAEVAEVAMLAMTDKGLKALQGSSLQLGVDASVVAGPVGASAASDLTADIYTFSRAKGLYGGVNLDGTVLTTNDDWNARFYGKKVTPADILVREEVNSKRADRLRSLVAAASK